MSVTTRPSPGPPGRSPGTETVRRLDDDQVRAVMDLVHAVTDADGVRPLNEHVMLHLRYGGDIDVRHVLRYAGDALVGYGHLDVTDTVEGSSAEMAVHPEHRRAGHGREVVTALLDASPDGRLRLWAHGEHPGAQRLAEGMGFRRSRVLWQMRRSLFAPLPAPVVPDGVEVRAFRPGEDDEPWVALNARAFADHPEQGQMTLDDLRRRMQEPWFDPDGFFLATRTRGGSDGEPGNDELVGFHWTKVHGGDGPHTPVAEPPSDVHPHGHDPVGEVYVVGVAPEEQGAGLGKALTLVGLRRLRAKGLPLAMLYVEADNAPAIRVYEGLGFTHWDTDVMYRIGPAKAGGA